MAICLLETEASARSAVSAGSNIVIAVETEASARSAVSAGSNIVIAVETEASRSASNCSAPLG